MNIAICDDEKVIREQIKDYINKEETGICPELYETGDALLAADRQFDIVFLDIQMEGTDGIETAKALRQRDEDMVLIFITGIRDYVFEAFEVAAFHYLLKPIEESRFREVFRRAQRELEKRRKRQRETVLIKTRSHGYALDKDSILYIESKAKKVEIHTTGDTIQIYASMDNMQDQLGGGFYRCHRGYLVNLAFVAEYDSESITLSNGERVYMAKKKYGEFVKVYMRYLRMAGGRA